MKTTFIYALCEPGTRTVRYIGKANNPPKRFKQHLKDSTKTSTHLGNWLRLLVSRSEKPDLVILREVPYEQWELAEERYIRLAHGCRMNLTNSTDGGDGVTMTPEIRAKIGAKLRGSVHTPEHIAKTAAKKGVPHTPEHNKKIGDGLRGTIHPPEFGLAIRNRQLGQKLSPEHCVNIGKSKLGVYASEGTKEKMKRSQRLRRQKEPKCKRSDEARAKMSAAHIGVPWSAARRAAYERTKAEEGVF